MESTLIQDNNSILGAMSALGRFGDYEINQKQLEETPRKRSFPELIGLYAPYTAEISQAKRLLSTDQCWVPTKENMLEARRIILEARNSIAHSQQCYKFTEYLDLNTWRTLEAKQAEPGENKTKAVDELDKEFQCMLSLVPFNYYNPKLFNTVTISPSNQFIALSKAVRLLDLALASTDEKEAHHLVFNAEMTLFEAKKTG